MTVATANRTDAEIQADVLAELKWEPRVQAPEIGVAVKDGVVTLTGHLDTYAEKYAAERALRRVTGVKAIALELDVRLSPEHRRSDTDIAESIKQTIAWNTLVPSDRIRITVDKGWVTLNGEVEWDYQRRSVEKAVRPLMGVVGISNELVIRPKVTPQGVQSRITDALQRQVEREMKGITVGVDGSTVTLRGTVHSWHERDAAQGAAWSAPGVCAVVNDLRIA